MSTYFIRILQYKPNHSNSVVYQSDNANYCKQQGREELEKVEVEDVDFILYLVAYMLINKI